LMLTFRLALTFVRFALTFVVRPLCVAGAVRFAPPAAGWLGRDWGAGRA